MAGKYVEIVNPGYSTLYTRDLAYNPNTSNSIESASLDVFNPDASGTTGPLYEGEWLQLSGITNPKFQRGGDSDSLPTANGSGYSYNDVAATNPGTSTQPCYLYFQERGRYDAQSTKKAHCITGPAGFEFTTKMCAGVTTSTALGTPLVVQWIELPNGDLVRGLVPSTYADGDEVGNLGAVPPAFIVGYVSRVHAQNHVRVQYNPHFAFVG